MELSEKDRLIIYNQYEILKKLHKGEQNAVENYEYLQEIVSCGYKYNYDELTAGIGDELPIDKAKFVWDVLQLFRQLYYAFDTFTEEQKEKISFTSIQYDGFDGNHECEYMSYARFILGRMHRFEEIYRDGKYSANSHSNRVNRYARMLEKRNNLGVKAYDELTFDQVREIISY